LCFTQFLTEVSHWTTLLLNVSSELIVGGVSLYIKALVVIWVSSQSISSNEKMHFVKCSLHLVCPDKFNALFPA
jgi:hypothetical protein